MGADLEVKVKKWGNSFGFLVSKKDADRLDIHENQKLLIIVEKKVNPLQELAGSLKLNKPTKQLLKEAREGFSKWGL